jgi:hypothetical protein
MYDASTVRSPIPRGRQATIFDACLAAAARGLRSLVTAMAGSCASAATCGCLRNWTITYSRTLACTAAWSSIVCGTVELSEPTLP